MSIRASVGERGVNLPDDVETVQKLLNDHSLPPLRSLDVNGIADQNTIAAIRHFQSIRVGLKDPDGRVDPGGRTMKQLLDVRAPGSQPYPEEKAETSHTRTADSKARRDFVRDDNVKELPTTTRIIDAIRPYFEGVRAVVVSAYLNDSDRLWKINYHWEFLVWLIDASLKTGVTEEEKKTLREIRAALMSCKPDPEVGYRESLTLGKPEDQTSPEDFNRRYTILKQRKANFKAIMESAELKKKSTRVAEWGDLAVAMVAHPGMSKHSTGYAVDIEGDNAKIKSICRRLGATLVFDEQSHVHVEFKNGVSESG